MDFKGFTKKSTAQKLWLKINNKEEYKQYKLYLNEYKKLSFVHHFINNYKTLCLDDILDIATKTETINAVHSGNAGDIIYALPTLKEISHIIQKPVNLYLKINQPLELPLHFTHPLGNVMLNSKMIEMLIPLITGQSYINICEVYQDQNIHIDLDLIRKGAVQLDRGNVANWYSYTTGINTDLSKKWVEVKADLNYQNKMIIARSERYRNSFIDYSFLSKYTNLYFIGVLSEYENIKTFIPNIKWIKVQDFSELAQIIAGCKLFIGNQSFPFAVAEGLKVKRILETYFDVPNVIPQGENAYDFYFQEHFESLVKLLYR